MSDTNPAAAPAVQDATRAQAAAQATPPAPRQGRRVRPGQTVGERVELIDSKTATVAPLRTPDEIRLEQARLTEAAGREKFPTDLAESMKLLARLNGEQVSTEEDWRAKQPRLTALKLHIHKIQQGLPVIQPSANDHAACYQFRRANEQRRKLEILARSNPELQDLLTAHDALAARVKVLETGIQQATDLDALRASLAPAKAEPNS